jgi:hypothetical protein
MTEAPTEASNQAQPKLHVPIWAKVLLALFIIAIIALVGGLAAGTAWLVNMERSSRDPQQMPFVARRVALLDQPLPKGFVYRAAAAISDFITVQITHDSDHMVFYLFRTPLPKDVTAEALAHQAAKQSPFGVQPIASIKEEGKFTVGGEEMPYVIGATSSIDGGGSGMELVAATVPKGKHAAVILFGISPGNNYNMDTTRELLSAIKGF